MNIRKLKIETTYAANKRGHDLIPRWLPGSRSMEFYRECRTCGARVYIDGNPPMNGTGIAGRAVALNCPAED